MRAEGAEAGEDEDDDDAAAKQDTQQEKATISRLSSYDDCGRST